MHAGCYFAQYSLCVSTIIFYMATSELGLASAAWDGVECEGPYRCMHAELQLYVPAALMFMWLLQCNLWSCYVIWVAVTG